MLGLLIGRIGPRFSSVPNSPALRPPEPKGFSIRERMLPLRPPRPSPAFKTIDKADREPYVERDKNPGSGARGSNRNLTAPEPAKPLWPF